MADFNSKLQRTSLFGRSNNLKPGLRLVYLAFNKSIEVEMAQKIMANRSAPPLVGSEEQEDLWKEMKEGSGHIECKARAGSGKSTSALEGARRMSGLDMQTKTYHSFGLQVCRDTFGQLSINGDRIQGILDRVVPIPTAYKRGAGKTPVKVNNWKPRMIRAGTAKLVSLAKQYDARTTEEFEELVDTHNLQLKGFDQEVLEATHTCLELCADVQGEVDFDDMIWLPKRLGLPVRQVDMAISDESQDLSASQQYLVTRAGQRVVVIGDDRQSIYGWRGATVQAMNNIKAELSKTKPVRDMHLTITRRCPQSHVELAQQLVPDIRAMDDAPIGVIKEHGSTEDAQPGDMVICRVNAPLLGACYDLIRRGIPATVKGRDAREGLERLISDTGSQDGDWADKALQLASEYTAKERVKLAKVPEGKGAARAQAAQDRLDCLIAVSHGAESVKDIKGRIAVIFEEKGPEVRLGSIHASKGLEAGRVFLLAPEKVPHHMAMGTVFEQQELNCAYIAVTRAQFIRDTGQQGELVFCGKAPSCFEYGPEKKQVGDKDEPEWAVIS